MSKIVKNSKNGLVFTPGTKESKDGKSYGFYVVEDSKISMEGGFVREDKRTAILTMDNALVSKVSFKEGQEISGRIQRVESHTPFFEGQEPVINPKDSKQVLRGGKPFYRQDTYTADVNAVDTLIARDTVKVEEKQLEVVGSGLAK